MHDQHSAVHQRWLRGFNSFVQAELGHAPPGTSSARAAEAQDSKADGRVAMDGGVNSWAAERHWDTPLIWEMASNEAIVDVASSLLGSGPSLCSAALCQR